MTVLTLIEGCDGVSNPFEAHISKIRGSRTGVDGNVHIKNEEHQFTFYFSNESITDTKEKLKSFELPEDYVSFLSHYKSATLFKSATHNSGGYDVLSTELVIGYWKAYSIDHPYYPIVWSDISNSCICVDQDRIHSGKGYLTWVGSILPDDTIDIDLTFTELLKQLIEHDGIEFWDQPIEEEE